jgi:hypothetical protein
MRRPRLAPTAALAIAASFSLAARAQSRDAVAAQRLFEEGRVLTARGQIDEGCAKFADSEALDPAVGTLLNLASCAQRAGASATAWRRYREAAALAVDRADPVREAVARRGIDTIEKSLSRLTLTMPQRALPPGTVIRLDGTALSTGDLARPVPVDPGNHSVDVLAPGYRPWSTSTAVGPGPVIVAVTIPELEEVAAARPPDVGRAPVPAPPPPPPPRPVTVPAIAPDRSSSPHTGAWIAGGTTLVALGVGIFFGARASSTWNGVAAQCPAGRCPDAGTAARQAPSETDAARDGVVSTTGFVVAGAALVATAILFFVRPGAPDRSLALGADRTGIASAVIRFQ